MPLLTFECAFKPICIGTTLIYVHERDLVSEQCACLRLAGLGKDRMSLYDTLECNDIKRLIAKYA